MYDQGRVADGQAPGAETDGLLVVINAACAEADTAWIRGQLQPLGIQVSDHKGAGVLLALQGPEAAPRLEALSGVSLAGLPRFGHRQLRLAGSAQGAAAGAELFVGRTGYTGEDDFELLLDCEAGLALWQQLLGEGVVPCGLGARDTLRRGPAPDQLATGLAGAGSHLRPGHHRQPHGCGDAAGSGRLPQRAARWRATC